MSACAPLPQTLLFLDFLPLRPPRTLRLLSCRLNWVAIGDLLLHRRFSFALVNSTLIFAAIRCSAKGSSSGAPCSLPRSSTGWCGCSRAAFEPPRRIFPSESRGIVTCIRAWSDRSATGKIACFPSSLVCTSPHPPKRSSAFKSRPPFWRTAAWRLSSFRSSMPMLRRQHDRHRDIPTRARAARLFPRRNQNRHVMIAITSPAMPQPRLPVAPVRPTAATALARISSSRLSSPRPP